MEKFMEFLHKDSTLKFVSQILMVVAGVQAAVPEHTVLGKVLSAIVAVGASLGAFSSTGRAAK